MYAVILAIMVGTLCGGVAAFLIGPAEKVADAGNDSVRSDPIGPVGLGYS
jgi:hypothetical protein